MREIAICDDNINELSKMVEFINSYRITRNLDCNYSVFSNGFDLLSLIEKGFHFDVFCLDIIMPGFTGIEVAKEIRMVNKTSPILFFTASEEYALDSYHVKAVNYLVKPITKDIFFLALDELFEALHISKDIPSIIVKSTQGIQKIIISNLSYVEVQGRYVLYHLHSKRMIKCIDSFSTVYNALSGFLCFMKPHRSFLINMNHIDIIDKTTITLQNGAIVPIAQGKTKEMKQLYLSFQMEVK